MPTSVGLIGFGVLALACLAFFALLAGTLGYIVVFGDPDTKRWKAFAATHGWDCDGPWRLAGGHAGARWTLTADYDDDRGTGTVTWLQEGVPATAPRLLVVRRVDFERQRVRPITLALRDAGVGGPRFGRHWVVLAEDQRTGRTFLDERTEAAWLTALDAMPRMFADGDLVFDAHSPRLCLRAEGARSRPPLDEVAVFVRLGHALASRVTGL